MKNIKPIDVMVLASSLFALYLIFGNMLWWFGIVSLPLSAPVNNFVTVVVAIDIAILNLYILYRRGQSRVAA